MKKHYKICVERKEKANVENALNHLKVSNYKKFVYPGEGGYEFVYEVSLSKYDLLYLRLSCNTGTIQKFSTPIKKKTTIY